MEIIMKNKLALRLTESAMMIALATILSLLKLADLPYGGSITVASMLPILIIAQRYGVLWGLFTGCVHGAVQLLLGTSTLSYVTGWQSVLAVILLDYIIAFAVIGLGGLTKKLKSAPAAMVLGAVICGASRYACHVIAGATVWAGLSIPTSAALGYSFIYNATYMIPETIVLVVAGYFIASSVDFRAQKLTVSTKKGNMHGWARIAAILSAAVALIYDTVSIFAKLQNAESGEFDITGISQVNFTAVALVTAVCAVISVLLVIFARKKN